MKNIHARLSTGAICIAIYAVACSGNSSPPASSRGQDGGSTSPPGDGSAGAVSLQCTDLATAFCKIESQCDTTDMQANFGGSMGECVARTVSACPSVTETGTSTTTASIEACTRAIGQLSGCFAFASYVLGNDFGLCPFKPGTLADGDLCSDDSQCQGGFCGLVQDDAGAAGDAGATPSYCGACAAASTAPNCEENSECPSGQLCNGNGTCVTAGAEGAACDDSDPIVAIEPCQSLLYCKVGAPSADAGVAATTGTCAPLGTTGQACNPDDDVSDCADGLFCNAQGQCAAVQFVQVGGACDEVGLVCAGSSCAFASDAFTSGVCTAFVADGAACQWDSDCAYDAYCPNGTCVTTASVCN